MMSRTTGFLSGVLFLLSSSFATAAEVEAFFDASTNKLVLPHLEVNGEIFYATLTLIDGNSLTFRTDLENLVNLKVPEGQVVRPEGASIIGSWAKEGDPGTTVTFRSDKTYSQFENNVTPGDTTCSRGAESGTYSWEPTTGMLVARVTQDANKDCGLSGIGSSRRLYIESADKLRLIVSSAQETEYFVLNRIN